MKNLDYIGYCLLVIVLATWLSYQQEDDGSYRSGSSGVYYGGSGGGFSGGHK